MKNFFLTFSLALSVVLGSISIRHSVAGIGGSPLPKPPQSATLVALGIGGSPLPKPPQSAVGEAGIGGSPLPKPPQSAVDVANN